MIKIKKKYKTWNDIPDDGRVFLLKIPGRKKLHYAIWKGAKYDLDHPFWGGDGNKKSYSPILSVQNSKGKFLFSFFADEFGRYGKDWYAMAI